MSESIQESVRSEVEALHEFFCRWFPGTARKTDFESDFIARFDPSLVFIPPAGYLLGLQDLSNLVYKGYASNPDFRVQIRNVKVQREFDGYVLATYEEWQRNALASQPPDNGRVATVVFALSDSLRWVHIHETWLPRDVMDADPYDF